MGAGAVDDDQLIGAWAKQYHLPTENDKRALTDRKHLYRPPKSDAGGIAVALAVIGCWAALFIHGLWFIKLPFNVASGEKPSSWLHIAAVFFSLEFLYTGLFITTHDAMHGTIALRNRRLNDFMGWLAISLYAWFDYGMLHRKHWEHHNHTGVPHTDPDFHKGNPNLLLWYAQFMLSYSTPMQFVRIAIWSNLLLLAGAPIANQMLFMTAAPLLSSFRLFYYGTYVPHHPPKGHAGPMPWHVSRRSTASRLQSFLTCYHFDMHWEHHRWPYAPWWQLPLCRDLVRDAAKGPDSSSSSSSGVGAAKAGGKGAGADGEKEGCVLGGPMPSATSLRARQMAADCGVQDGEEGQGERKRGDVLAGDLAAAGAIAP